ncbi:shikimate dehydrogenase [Virgibacillus natechei]|uniref:Shikimate dehydrogenase (NADP(+)) n=1 Tax=Virgibacillus natechei TaxID=1216297 RepID=A0ABS4ICR3_9BACI|nr:shikimate dehydrogenase [Virgibacillus natechei]MBP1968733.1 shikimate dehydrogenase [Virgibacillus natechei]UZD11535.1 shikimate dehydrogenase [Virgibacillus natechei]
MYYRLALIGYPINHSLSPWIHEHFLEKANLNGDYSTFEISPDDSFSLKVKQLMNDNVQGFNVTVPYKEKIISFLDEIDESAEKIGAVNTVVNRNGRWIGYNTDGIGYMRSLESKFPNFHQDKAKRILIIGAGGATRGIYHALVQSGFLNIDITNRTTEKAAEIAKLKSDATTTNIFSLDQAEQMIKNYDVIIQTTSVGMKPNPDNIVFKMNELKETSIVSDIIYQPLETRLLKEAGEKGVGLHYGHTMLLYQAQYAFEIWTGLKVPMGSMDRQLKHKLEGR